MVFWNLIRKIFQPGKKKTHNERSFCEIARTGNMEEALEIKRKLEKYRIPVYMLDQRNLSRNSSGNIILRIPEKYLVTAQEALS